MGYGEVVTSVINGGLLQAVLEQNRTERVLYPYVRCLSFFCLTWDFSIGIIDTYCRYLCK